MLNPMAYVDTYWFPGRSGRMSVLRRYQATSSIQSEQSAQSP